MNPDLIPDGDEIQDMLTLVVITFQLMAADVHMATLMLFHQLPGHPSFINLAASKPVIHYSVFLPLANA
jgi:hypothetical protein